MDINAAYGEIKQIDERLNFLNQFEVEAWILRERRAKLKGAIGLAQIEEKLNIMEADIKKSQM